MKLGVKDKNVHFCTFRNQANFTRAGINGLKSSFVDFQNILKKCYFSFSPGSKQLNNVSTQIF